MRTLRRSLLEGRLLSACQRCHIRPMVSAQTLIDAVAAKHREGGERTA